MIRKPAVAGTFYQGTAYALESQIASLINREAVREEAVGVMSPHAGLVYSGAVAGAVYSRIGPADTFLIIGPNHTGVGEDVSVFSEGLWEFPMGPVSIDKDLADALFEGSGEFSRDATAHLSEHSIEVQVPFLQYLFGEFKIVPICMGRLTLTRCLRIGKAIARVVKESGKRVVIVASTDMSHYVSKDAAERVDRLALEAVEKRDPDLLYETVRKHRISMCGAIPTVSMIAASNELGATRARVINYTTSGDITGDYSQVVAYAGAIIN